ncbi:hypothetical protein FA13DRAFT_1704375 [Coprinellus micaceus]|uniref:Uncharacterized protein n=1 Tax=Coprinellus micaceus TaxID=71717 RepID=A0A4Y7TYH0_COPMI|nr:hypothetical protein FA13DRAFT_1704375 [Coprinellus micaceus]
MELLSRTWQTFIFGESEAPVPRSPQSTLVLQLLNTCQGSTSGTVFSVLAALRRGLTWTLGQGPGFFSVTRRLFQGYSELEKQRPGAQCQHSTGCFTSHSMEPSGAQSSSTPSLRPPSLRSYVITCCGFTLATLYWKEAYNSMRSAVAQWANVGQRTPQLVSLNEKAHCLINMSEYHIVGY